MTDDIQERIAEIRKEAEAASPFKLHQRVRACQNKSLNLITGERIHDCDDPEQHFLTRVVGWDSLGRIEVALDTRGSNPHCYSWCWSDHMLTPVEGYDWFTQDDPHPRLRRVDEKVFFMWEEPGWEREQPVGSIIPAVLVSPHIARRDWIVSYEVPSDKRWITRVVNEMQMWDRP